MSEKPCVKCKKPITNLPETLYCFSCDALFCEACIKKYAKKEGKNWTCPSCNTKRGIEESMLFKSG